VSVTCVPELKLALQVPGQLIPAGLLLTVPVSFPGRVTVNVGGPFCVKVAETDTLPFIVTMQPPEPLQAPPHSAKVELAEGLGVKVTSVPVVKVAVQTVPQLIPAGLLVTVPLPLPLSVTVNVGNVVFVKVAETDVLAFIVTAHAPVPLHAPPQPANVELATGLAVNVTWVPGVKLPVQTVPQLIPAGLLVTAPLPLPARITVNVGSVVFVKVAETDVSAFKVTAHTPVPVQAPPHPAKLEPLAGFGAKFT